MKKSTLIILLTALISFFLPSFALPDITQQSVRTSSIPLPFIENQGQLNSQVLYYGPTQAGTLFITRSGKHIFSLPKPESKSVLVIHEEFVGSKNTTPIGLVPSKAQINRYIGNDPKAWQEKLTTWQKIGINELYPGINYQLRPFSQYAEKIFVVNPGADPNQIQLEVKGVDELSIGKDGSLKLHSTIGELEYSPPIAYQEINEQRIPVEISYELKGNTYGFTIGVYDRKQPLVIDPLIRTTFFGGNDTESGYGIAVNQTSGSVYITGYTSSYDLPTTAGVFKEEKTDLQDIFVAKFDADLSTLEAATFYGTNGWEYGVAAIALHPDGSVYLTGKTQGTDLPGASSGYQSAYTGGTLGDAFVARLNEDLSGPPQATYFGGTGEEVGISITVNGYPGQDLYGSVYIAGRTSSVDLPGTSGGFLDTLQGTDVFVAYFDPTLQTLGQATYFGGTGWDEPASDARGQAMLIHPNTGSVLLVGNTGSNFIPSLSGDKIGTDGFYARLNAHLNDAQSGIFIGGNGEDLASAMAIMPIDGSPDVDVFIVGRTKSTEGLVDPAQVGYQTSYQGGNFDAFVVRLNGYITTEITESTYLGGEADDRGYGITVNPITGRVWVTGQTNSTGFPTSVNADQAAIAGADDAFTVSLSHDLSSLEYGSYLGGTTTDYGTALAVNASTGDVYLLGYTRSEDLYGTDTLSADDTHNGYGDAFIALFEEAQPPPLSTWVIDDFAFTNSWGPDLAIDDSGNLYACYFRGNLFYTTKRDVSTGQWATLHEFEKPAGDPGFSDCSIVVEANGGVHACMVTMPDKTDYQPTNDLWYIGPGAVGFEAVDADRSDLHGAEGQCDINLWNNMPSISYRIYNNNLGTPPYALAVAVKPAPDQSWIVMDNIRINELSPQAYWSGEDNYGEATALAFDSAGLPLAVFTDEDGTASFYVPSFYPPFVPTALPTWTRYTSAHSGKPLHLDWLNAMDFGGGNTFETFSLIGNVSGTKTAISWVNVPKSNGSVDDVIAEVPASFILDIASSSGVSDGSLSRHLVASHNNQARYMALDSLFFPLLNPIFGEPIDNPIAHSTEIIGEGLENCALAKEIDGIAHALCEDDTGNIVYAR
ncbi:MAG: hypothetical protein OEL85_02900, partial [Desulfobulbaceae bacterium]|nr:hypothetical protein [Desulfobulbaceae bacterium]